MQKFTEGSWTDRLSHFLFHYRSTPHSTTGVTPAELLLGRKLRSRLDVLRPDVESKVMRRQMEQKRAHDRRAHNCVFTVGERVYARHYGHGQPRWVPACVVQVTGPLSYLLELEDGTTIRRHQDQTRKRFDSMLEDHSVTVEESDLTPLLTDLQPPVDPHSDPLVEHSTSSPDSELCASPDSDSCGRGRRYPTRNRRPPDRLSY